MIKSAILFFTLAICVTAQAQFAGDIRGMVTDSIGHGLAAARVDVINRAGATIGRGTIADVDGRYALVNLNPGKYSIQYSCKGYTTTIVNAVVVNADHETSLEVALHKASGKEIQVVQYVAPLMSFQGVKIK